MQSKSLEVLNPYEETQKWVLVAHQKKKSFLQKLRNIFKRST